MLLYAAAKSQNQAGEPQDSYDPGDGVSLNESSACRQLSPPCGAG